MPACYRGITNDQGWKNPGFFGKSF